MRSGTVIQRTPEICCRKILLAPALVTWIAPIVRNADLKPIEGVI
jgi:hypothetical protein